MVHNRLPWSQLWKKKWASGWTFAPFSRFCSKMETKTGQKAMSSQPCQYILIFCLAEKLCLDTLSHCLENNFTPLQSDVHTASQIKARKLNTKRRFQTDGGYYHKRNYIFKKISTDWGGQNHHHKTLQNKQLKIPSQIGMQSWTEIPRWTPAKHRSPLVKIRIQPATLE